MSGHIEVRPVDTEDPGTRGRFMVVAVGGNGEVLSISEGLETLAATETNIAAQAEAFASGDVRVLL